MNFSTPSRVLQTIRAGDNVERIRSENRRKVNDAANCVPPFTREEAKKIGLKICVNFGEMMDCLAEIRRQLISAFWSNNNFFKVMIPLAPADHQGEWEAFITEQINSVMRESRDYFELHNSRWTSVASHGVGPMHAPNEDDWCWDYVSMSDLRIPTDTTINFKNLDWYSVRKAYTPGELLVEAFKKGAGNKWDKRAVVDILKSYKEINWDYGANNYNLETDVEKFAELVRQDGGYYMGDAMPTIPLWHFYFKDDTEPDNKGWFMRVVPETSALKAGVNADKFLWTSNTPEASKLEHLLHCQFGDISNDAPVKYHSLRAPGYALMEPIFYSNLTRCRLLQHVHDNFNIWLRSSDPVDKARAQVQEFGNLGIVKPGLSIIPQNERHQIEGDLVEMALAQTKQLEQRVSSTYSQSADTGTKKEETAFAVGVKVRQLNAMLTGILLRSFIYETQAYREICRRFCRQDSKNEDVQKVQERCKEMGIPRKWMDVKYWKVEAVTPLGMGNPTLAQSAATQLMEFRGQYDPTAQQEILHEATLAITQDPRKAARWVPLGNKATTTQGGSVSQANFGTLMTGVEFNPPEGVSPIEQFEAMVPLLAGKIAMIEKRDNMAEPDEAFGFQAVNNYMTQLIQRLAQNEQEKQRVKQYGDQLGELMNQVKGLVQRGQEAKQKEQQQNGANGGLDPETAAKIHGQMALAAVKAHTTEQKAKLNAKLNAERHVRDERRKDAAALSEIQRQQVKTAANGKMKAFEE